MVGGNCMIEYKYDEKIYRRMAMRINLWIYVLAFGIVSAAFVVYCASFISESVQKHKEATFVVMSILLLLLLFGLFIGIMAFAMRKQMSKAFQMYSVDGVIHEKVEFANDELIITNVPRQNVVKLRLSSITAVKLYKSFFAVVNINKAKWVVPLNEQTQLLYDALTGKADIAQLATEVKTEGEGISVDETVAEHSEMQIQSNALGFEYELTEPQAISMLTKIISVRFRIVLAAIIFASIVAAGILAFVVADLVAGNTLSTGEWVTAIVLAVGIALLSVAYSRKNKQGRVSGGNYFTSGAKDGEFHQRIELYDQGIIVINTLRDTRVCFRFADMDRVCLFKDFFYVQFKSTEILPIPLTDSTKRLYDILKSGVIGK